MQELARDIYYVNYFLFVCLILILPVMLDDLSRDKKKTKFLFYFFAWGILLFDSMAKTILPVFDVFTDAIFYFPTRIIATVIWGYYLLYKSKVFFSRRWHYTVDLMGIAAGVFVVFFFFFGVMFLVYG